MLLTGLSEDVWDVTCVIEASGHNQRGANKLRLDGRRVFDRANRLET